MGDEFKTAEPETPTTKAAKAEPKDESQPENMTKEEFATLRRDIWRMWNAEPEETR